MIYSLMQAENAIFAKEIRLTYNLARVECGDDNNRLVSLPVIPGISRMRRRIASKVASVGALSSAIKSHRPFVV